MLGASARRAIQGGHAGESLLHADRLCEGRTGAG